MQIGFEAVAIIVKDQRPRERGLEAHMGEIGDMVKAQGEYLKNHPCFRRCCT